MTGDEFAVKLKEYRRVNFLTQEQMAKLLGLSPNHIGTLEHGLKKPRASTVAAFEELTQKKNWKNWKTLDETELMTEEELKTYTRLWRGLRSLEPQQERELLDMFFRMLDWL